jgi:hypothetical protein
MWIQKMTITKLFGSLSVAAVLVCNVAQAHASAIQLTAVSELSASDTVVTFPVSLPNSGAFDLSASGITLEFSSPGVFGRFDSDGATVDFPLDTRLLDVQGGPLTITFLSGIREVGLFAQSIAFDDETFAIEVFQGSSSLKAFDVGTADNNGLPGVALFIGARATDGDLITRLTITNMSSSGPDTEFVIGPVAFGQAIAAEPVPEPTSLILLGSGLLYGARRLRRRSV